MSQSTTKALSWEEPFWSYSRRRPSVDIHWAIPLKVLLRLWLVGIMTFAAASTVFWFLLPTVFPRVFLISVIACGLYMIALPLWFLLGERVVLFAYWLCPPVVRVSAAGIDIFVPGQTPIKVTMDSLVLLIVRCESPTRRTLTIEWQDNECTIGIPSGLDLTFLREVVGGKYHECPG